MLLVNLTKGAIELIRHRIEIAKLQQKYYSRRASGFTRGAGSVTQTTKLVTPNGTTVQQDSSGNLGIFNPSATETNYFDSNGNLNFVFLPTSESDQTKSWIGQQNGEHSITVNSPTAIIRFYTNGSNLIRMNNGFFDFYNTIQCKGFGLSPIYGLDNRSGITAVDASPITLYTTTASGQLYEISARAFATVGTSATYVIKWTEGGVVNTITLSVTALDTIVTQPAILIQPDSGTNITAQITAISSTTLNVATKVSQIA